MLSFMQNTHEAGSQTVFILYLVHMYAYLLTYLFTDLYPIWVGALGLWVVEKKNRFSLFQWNNFLRPL